MADTVMDQLRAQKDAAYRERNQLVAVLSKLFPSHLMIHPAADATWEDGWRTIVCVHTPPVNAVWHIHDSERELVAHLEGGTLTCDGWDGHSSEEKYRRLSQLEEGPSAVIRAWFDVQKHLFCQTGGSAAGSGVGSGNR